MKQYAMQVVGGKHGLVFLREPPMVGDLILGAAGIAFELRVAQRVWTPSGELMLIVTIEKP